MMRFLKSEAGAIILWLAASLLVAALLTPNLYGWGKALFASTELVDYPAAVESIAASAGRAKPDRYFSRSLLISALALLPLLIRYVKCLPCNPSADAYALRQLPWSKRLIHLTSGLLIGSASLVALALVLEACGAAVPRETGFSITKFFSKAFVPALGVGIIEELLFRGLLLGLWLRTYSVRTAWIGSSVMFSVTHFLSPPDGMVIADPQAWYAGFEILGGTLGHFANPLFFVTDFTMLTLTGLLLGWCRIRTFSLWLPIGLHAGLVLALKTISMVRGMNIESPLPRWVIGNDMKSGLLPLAALCFCFACCTIIVRIFSAKSDRPDTGKL
jgi:membrane protease YdiL (CAAX protease family)